jgi:hypothetical protein
MATDLSEHVIQALYNRALSFDIEFTASAFWQALMQYNFRLEDGYVSLCEQSPDENDRTRLDQIVFQLTANNTLVKCFMVESKRRGAGSAHLVEAERQARDGAERAINRGDIGAGGIFAMTTWRTHFRLWHMGPNARSWAAADGGPMTKGDRASYLEIGVPENRARFDGFIQRVKNPQAAAAGAAQPWQDPSQPSPALHDAASAQERQYLQYEQQLHGGAETQPEQFPTEWVEESATEPAEQFAEAEYYSAGGGPSTQASRTQPWVRVQVKVEKRRGHPDEWVFNVENGRRRIESSRWVRAEHGGQMVWAYYGKHTTYFTRQAI